MDRNKRLLVLSSLTIILFFSACNRDPYPLLTMDNGYQYIHYIQNDGPKPQAGEVAYYYFITRVDDSLLMNGADASMVSKMQIPEPLSSPRKHVSPTLEALKLMSIGDSLTVIVPFDSLPEMPPSFGVFDNFYYDLKLIDIKSQEENQRIIEAEKERNSARMEEVGEFMKKVLEDYEAGSLDETLIEKPSGLKYIIHEEGSGTIPVAEDIVQVHYHGMVVKGAQLFDSSFPRPFTYPIKVGKGAVVKGWDEALTYLKRGTKATIFVPSDLGYGDEGNLPAIPPKAELAYYLEIIK